MLKIATFVFNPFSENTYVVSDETQACVIIDPGCYDRAEQAELEEYISEGGLQPVLLLNTHCHIDHVFGNAWVKRKYNIPLLAHKIELSNLERTRLFADAMGLHYDSSPLPDTFIDEGFVVEFGQTKLEVLFVPGHAAGHVAFYDRPGKNLFSGDVLFQGSIGRTDLPGGSYDVLMDTIFNKVLPLGDDITIWGGHMSITTTGQERKTNPYLLGRHV